MKDFSQWLTDLTNDLRDVSQESQKKQMPSIDYNAIHPQIVSAIKSVAWRAENQLPMEIRITDKLQKLFANYLTVKQAMMNEVKAGLRKQSDLDEFNQRTENWINALLSVVRLFKPGDIPEWTIKDRYTAWTIDGI